jgi:hypothetical protein
VKKSRARSSPGGEDYPDKSRPFIQRLGISNGLKVLELGSGDGTTAIPARAKSMSNQGSPENETSAAVLQGPAPQSRTFPAQDTRCKQGHAFANRPSRDWRLLKEDKKRLCGDPNDQQEGRSSHCKHHERPEMMIVRLTAQWAFFFHATRWYQPESADGLHRKKKKPIAGRSQAYTEQAKD